MDRREAGLSGIYLSVLGTSAEDADSGEVGRGNQVNGIIALNRPRGSEAAAGKNLVSHVGKIYSVLTHLLARRLCLTGLGIAAAGVGSKAITPYWHVPAAMTRDDTSSFNHAIYLPKGKFATTPLRQMSQVSRLHGQMPAHDSLATHIDAVADRAAGLIFKLAAGDDLHLTLEEGQPALYDGNVC